MIKLYDINDKWQGARHALCQTYWVSTLNTAALSSIIGW